MIMAKHPKPVKTPKPPKRNVGGRGQERKKTAK